VLVCMIIALGACVGRRRRGGGRGNRLELPQPGVAGAFMEEPERSAGRVPRGVRPPAPSGSSISILMLKLSRGADGVTCLSSFFVKEEEKTPSGCILEVPSGAFPVYSQMR